MDNVIDGILLKSMIISGANNLENNKKLVDDLNVFPVPDGDTGTNMSMTISAAARALLSEDSESASKIADVLASASLRGARGNSGVILSQLFRGISRKIAGADSINIMQTAECFKAAADTAYKAVMKPTEGTILTVAREAAEAALTLAETIEDPVEFLTAVTAAAKESLDKTPELLPVLKQAGVVDAGGMGLLVLLEGALFALKGNPVTASEAEAKQPTVNRSDIDTANIKFMYCTEFIINKRSANYSVTGFKGAISSIGDCMLVIDDAEIVKVHIHTNSPGFVLEQAVKIGDLSNIKIDNMKIQHNEILNLPTEPPKDFGIVSVANGDGIESLFNDVGADAIVHGGQSMNPSAEDIADAVESVNAKTVFIFPNNKNIILAAEQVCHLTKKTVIVIPTKTIPQGISAALAFNPSESAEANKESMTEAALSVKTGSVTFASRSSEMDGLVIKQGDIMGMLEGKIENLGDDPSAVAAEITNKLCDESSSLISVYYGCDVDSDTAQALADELTAKYDGCDVMLHYGGQPIYYYIISAE